MKLEDAGSAGVEGRQIPIRRLRYLRDLRSDDASGSPIRAVLDEVAVLPAGRGFWVLRFSSPESGDEPNWEADWKGFLASFQIKS